MQKTSKTNISAKIDDTDCMKSEYWIDYSTDTLNQEFVTEAKHAKEMGVESFLSFVKSRMPNWIIDECDEYDSDLSQLSRNWNMLCNRFKVPTQKILLVEYLAFGEKEEVGKHKNLNLICDILTSLGFVVKDKQHFKICDNCHKLMLSDHVQKSLWTTNTIWKVCRQCTQSLASQ